MREEGIHKIEVHVSGICFNVNKVLLLKRTYSRRLYPEHWECGGGQIHENENFEEAVVRQLREEAGIIIKPLRIVGMYEIQLSVKQKIPGIIFACKFEGYVKGKQPKISNEHSEWRWQELDKLYEVDLIPGLKQDIKKAYKLIASALLT